MKKWGVIFFAIITFYNCDGTLEDEVQSINTEVELGRKLFFDPILSSDKTISCSSCHKPEFAFADNRRLSLGVGDSLGIRNTPSVMNMASRPHFFYDGRASSLEEQAKHLAELIATFRVNDQAAPNRHTPGSATSTRATDRQANHFSLPTPLKHTSNKTALSSRHETVKEEWAEF